MRNFITIIAAAALVAFNSAFDLKSSTTASDDGLIYEKMFVEDVSGPTERQYAVQVPSGYDPSKKTPLMIYFHGYMSHWPPRKTSYREVSERENFLVVFPKGMGDFDGVDNPTYLGWNTGLNTDYTPEQQT